MPHLPDDVTGVVSGANALGTARCALQKAGRDEQQLPEPPSLAAVGQGGGLGPLRHVQARDQWQGTQSVGRLAPVDAPTAVAGRHGHRTATCRRALIQTERHAHLAFGNYDALSLVALETLFWCCAFFSPWSLFLYRLSIFFCFVQFSSQVVAEFFTFFSPLQSEILGRFLSIPRLLYILHLVVGVRFQYQCVIM